ncbi:MAG: prolipoprotein diacylglyceryl transferase [Acidobacteria bacterium]|nr:prolipoprotein diacylglyceryl transferase [Acidobacteriota bacterium]
MRRVLMQWLVEHGLTPWIIPNFWFLLCLSIILGSLWTLHRWRREGQPVAVASDLLFWGIPSLLVGAKLLYLAQFGLAHWHGWTAAGLSLYGGLVGLLGAWIVTYAFSPYRFLLFLDVVTPSLALGLFLTRIGCFLNGCNGGRVSGVSWAMRFPPDTNVFEQQVASGQISESALRSLPVHPTQLYESLFGLLCLVFLLLLSKRRQFEGQIFFTGMLWYSTYRFLTEFLRADNGGLRPLGVLTFAQAVSLALFSVSLALVLTKGRRSTI